MTKALVKTPISQNLIFLLLVDPALWSQEISEVY